MPQRIAIVYHSGFGHTKRVADAVAEGVRSAEGTELTVLTSEEASGRLDELDGMDGLIFGTPTYMGGPSAAFKAFMDASGQKWLKHAWKDKIAAGFTTSSSYSGDKQSCLIALATLALQHGMVWVGQGEMPGEYAEGETPDGKPKHGPAPGAINRLGSFTGLMTQSDNAPPEETPSAGDLETARRFGRRVAETTARWARGRA